MPVDQIVNNLQLPQNLGDGLVLSWGVPEDVDEVAEFNANIHSDTDQPDEPIGVWTRELFSGEHPTTKASDFTIVRDTNNNNKLVSTMNLISQTWSYDGISFKAGRPEAVGTLSEYRRKGLVRTQFNVIHQKSAVRGELLQGITGIPWYYRQFGYEMALNLNGARRLMWSNISKLDKGENENFQIRQAGVTDIPILAQLYKIHCSSSLVCRVRNEIEWHYELTSTKQNSIAHHRFFIIENLSGTTLGYFEAAYRPQAIAVREVAVMPGQNLRLICEYLTRALKDLSNTRAKIENKETMFDFVSFSLGMFHPVYVALGNQLEKQLQPYAWYIRIPDLTAFLRQITPALERRLENSVMENYSGKLHLNFYRNNLAIVFEKGKIKELGTYQPKTMQDGDALFPDQTFLQLLMGYHSLDELKQNHPDLYPQNERANVLLNILFPKRPSQISPLD